MRYGLPYKGSKNGIAKWIVDALPEADIKCQHCHKLYNSEEDARNCEMSHLIDLDVTDSFEYSPNEPFPTFIAISSKGGEKVIYSKANDLSYMFLKIKEGWGDELNGK